MEDIGNVPQDAEVLVRRYLERPQPDLKDLIMVQFAGLVERIARRFAGMEPFEDLVQVGYIGLLNALSKFDPATGVKFATYATHLVAGEIKHYLRDKALTIRHPAWLQELRHRIQRAASELHARLGRPPTELEIAREVGVSEQAVLEVYQTQELLKVGSLDVTIANDEESDSEGERLDSADFAPEQLSVEDRVVLENAMAQLRDLERQVLVLFHFESLNQTEIAHQLGISCNYVSHILRQSLAKLRRILVSEDEKDRLLRRQAAVLTDDVIDEDTGIYNADYFRARLAEEVHRAVGLDQPLGLVVVEFFHLNALRGYFGEASVRHFLAEAAETIRNQVRRLDIVCRAETSSFGILLPSTGEAVTVVRDRLARTLGQWLTTRRAPSGPVTFAIGSAYVPAHGRTAAQLLEAARPDARVPTVIRPPAAA